ncbi:response regulator [Sediminitomix flava]|uniref:Response regulator receiver domain-containing protein n=1 Tax=Sediminitomix flava TaxID=379075 RepID=A0A315ZHR8_SEDFL|nr:response regulator [Sediminitomix flava]PWJ44852.1 response regulator receiver domain-containing protein [Sediminitomix flava]
MDNKTVRHVLLVDDNDTDNFIHKRILELTDFSQVVSIKNSGKSALEYLSLTWQETPELLPSIIFLDINMPIVDGFVFLFEFESFPEDLKNRIKLVILSNTDNQRDIDRVVKNEYVDMFISKPLTEDHLPKISQLFELTTK